MIDSGGKKKQNREKAIILEIWEGGGGGNEANFSDFQLSSVFMALKYIITH